MRRKIHIRMKQINSLITDFLEYLEIEKGRSLLTVQNYDRYLKDFSFFAKKHGAETPEKISQDLVKQYRLSLNRRALYKSTQNYYLIALRSFLKYLGRHDIKALVPEKIELAKTDGRQITFLEEDELESLLNQPVLSTPQGRRDKAILDLLFSTGLRVSELCQLKIADINLDRSEFSVKGKGGKVRVVFLDHEAKESLKRYLDLRHDKSEWLFIPYGHTNSQDTRNKMQDTNITPRSVQRMIHKYALQAGITKKVTPHVLRHSFATDLLMSGADLRSVQTLLGHSSVTTTQIYTHVTDQHLQEVHEAFHGLRRSGEENLDEDNATTDHESKQEEGNELN